MAKTTARPGTALQRWDEELAREAEIASKAEANAGGGAFFSFRGGILAFNDAPVPDNRMAVVIVDGIFENVFYEGAFDANNPSPPTCFAFAREEADLQPHAAVVEAGQAQNDVCRGCEWNEWGTSDRGRGKACRNTRRLAVIPAGEYANDRFAAYTDAEHFEKAPIGFLKLPVTSVKGYANFVKQVAGALRRPPHGIFAKVSVAPDAKTQFRVLFEPIANVPDALMAAVMKRREEARSIIAQPYPLSFEDEPAAKPAARGAAKGKPTPAKRAAKY
jgi:hypothetical protein